MLGDPALDRVQVGTTGRQHTAGVGDRDVAHPRLPQDHGAGDTCGPGAGDDHPRSGRRSAPGSRPLRSQGQQAGPAAPLATVPPVEIRELAVPDSYVLDLVAHGDDRGSFTEWYRADVLASATGRSLPLAQANHSVSALGVLRGVHFALVPPGQAKYVYCPAGRVLDVVVDVRVGSPTFGVSDAVLLEADRPRAVFLAEGLGHAFLALEDRSSVTYLVSTGWSPGREFALSPLDPDLALPWPADVEFRLSDKDRAAPTLAQARELGVLPTVEQCTARYAQQRAGS